MSLASINMKRVYLIARRDFLGYVKTWGFWISFFLPFILGGIVIAMSLIGVNVLPDRYETIIDETGLHAPGIMQAHSGSSDFADLAALMNTDTGGDPGVKTYFVAPPVDTMDELQPYLLGKKLLNVNGERVELGGALHLFEEDGQLKVSYWSRNITNQGVKRAARDYFRDKASENYLSGGGLSLEGLRDAQSERTPVVSFNPKKEATGEADSQAVTFTDQIPNLVASALAIFLWLSVFSGSYMLLTSMLEEKLNKLMEMMLASTRFSEIILGKLIGVAALTTAAMTPYLVTFMATVIGFVLFGDAETAKALTEAFTLKLVIFFFVFLVLGYVFYGSLFIALGSLAESMQDAQTLTTPIMLVLVGCMMIVPFGQSYPDSKLLDFAAWFPLSTPFASIARLPSDPPWWELTLSALFLFIVTIGVIWVAGRVFKYGVLSGAGVKGVKDWFARVIFRRKSA